MGSLGVVAAAGAGVWAWQAFVAQGPQPSEALPRNTLAYVAIDLDPPGGQKLEALGVLKKVPSLKKDLGLDTDDDVRRSAFEEFAAGGSCTLDYDNDVKPWIGDRAAFAIVDQATPEPVVVLQVQDADAAGRGLDSVRDCARENGLESGYVLDGDWVVLARTEAVARTVVEGAGRGTLADDQTFKERTGAAGEPGVVTLYAAPEAGPALLEAVEQEPFFVYSALPIVMSAVDPIGTVMTPWLLMGVMAPPYEDADQVSEGVMPPPELTPAEQKVLDQFEHFDELTKVEQDRLLEEHAEIMEKRWQSFEGAEPDIAENEYEDEGDHPDRFPVPELPADLRAALEDFSGAGGVVRFEDGGVEVEIVSDRLEGTFGDLYDGEAGDDLVSAFPDDTAIAFGAGLGADWANQLMAQLSSQFSFDGPAPEEAVAAFERSTGLDVPGDLEALGGEAVSLAADAGFDPEELFDAPEQGRVAARIKGDPVRIEAALAKIRAALPAQEAGLVLSRRVDDGVVVGAHAAYLDELAAGGGLGETGRFRAVVPDADTAASVLFVDFDAGDWLARLAPSEQDRADVEPLDALGYSVHLDGDRVRTLVRLRLED